MMLTPSRLESAFLNFNTVFQQTLLQVPTYWSQIATEVPSTTSEELYPFLDTIPEMREWLGEREMLNLAARIYGLKNKDFERSFKVPRSAFEDDKLGLYMQGTRLLAEAAAQWPDKLVVDALQAGGAATTYDNQFFFDTDHPYDMDNSLGSQSNKLTLALNFANYGTARATMMAYKTKDNVPMGIIPDLLVVPPQLEDVARQILNADFLPNSGGTAPQSNIWKGSAKLLVLPRLANEATTWYLMCTSRVIKPLIFQKRKAPVFTSLTSITDSNVFHKNQFEYGVDSRGAAGYGPWFLALESTP